MPLYLQSALYQDVNQPAQARAALTKATQIQPENPTPWLWLAQLDVKNGRSAAALDAANQVMLLNLPVDSTRFAARDVILQAQAQQARRQAAATRAHSRKHRRSRAAK
jgi:Tfp pilus assembly protein PilF